MVVPADEARQKADLEWAQRLVRIVLDPALPGMILTGSFVVAGFAIIAFAWRAVARTYFVIPQMPAIVSGGFVGVALIGTGLTLLVVQLVRRASAHELAAINAALDEAIDVLTKTLEVTEADSDQVGAGSREPRSAPERSIATSLPPR